MPCVRSVGGRGRVEGEVREVATRMATADQSAAVADQSAAVEV